MNRHPGLIQFCRFLTIACCLLSLTPAFSQKKYAFVSGKVLDENENPLSKVSVVILGQQKGIITSDSGTFHLKVNADRAFALVFSFTGYRTEQRNFLLNENEEEYLVIRMERGEKILPEVVITDQRDRSESGLIRPNPKNIINIPSPLMGVESMIKVIVGSNNELTSQYNVRGGNYDENLIYVNDFEIFRPYLVRNGQQEGLSFINPEMTRNISFYNGGFQAKYGDKMSSVLDIQYKKPKRFAGSAYLGVLEQGLHLEGSSANNKFSYLIGVRNRTNKNLVSKQETQGNYIPASTDLQALLDYRFNDRWQAELMGNISRTKFTLVPEFSQLTSSVFSPYFTAVLGLDIYFAGQEKDQYQTNMLGFALTHQPGKNLKLKWMVSAFEDDEQENIDIMGAYLFGERDFDKSKSSYGMIVNPLGAGVFQTYARNKLNILNWSVSHKGSFNKGKQLFQWGLSYDHTSIDDKLNEWEYQDSAGYSLPYNPDLLQLNKVLKSSAQLDVNKLSGYFQDNLVLGSSTNPVTLQTGARFNYNSLNGEFIITPRIGASWKPNWEKDIIFRAAAGLYYQPPFYRELRKYDGTINTALLSQKSWQLVGGFDYNFKSADKPMRVTMEAYYKHLWDVVPYDIDNVRIRYYGENNAKAYAVGVESRLFGELVKDAESWISLGIMQTKENIAGDYYKEYTLDSLYQPVDSMTVEGGWFRRPTDRRITFGIFFQDYLSTNKNFRVYLNGLYGSNLPFNIPGSVKYRNAAIIEPYIRVDIGFSAVLLDSDRSQRRSHSPTRGFDNITATLEIFNLLDRENTISYFLVKDFANNVFTIPIHLTPRLVNFKIIARW